MHFPRKLTALMASVAAVLLLVIVHWLITGANNQLGEIASPSLAYALIIGAFQLIWLYLLVALRQELKLLLVSGGTQILLTIVIGFVAFILAAQCFLLVFTGVSAPNVLLSTYNMLASVLIYAVVVLTLILGAFGISLGLSHSLSTPVLRWVGVSLAVGAFAALIVMPLAAVALLISLGLLVVHFARTTVVVDIV